MAIANDLHTLFGARCEAFEIFDGQPTDIKLYCIVEDIAKLFYPIQFDKEGGNTQPYQPHSGQGQLQSHGTNTRVGMGSFYL